MDKLLTGIFRFRIHNDLGFKTMRLTLLSIIELTEEVSIDKTIHCRSIYRRKTTFEIVNHNIYEKLKRCFIRKIKLN